jgi:phenylalanyl-tRNA synthetase beta chain
MRQSMLFSGLSAISHNINRKRPNLKLFEFGKTYHQYESERVENKHLTVFTTGNRNEDSWAKSTEKTDFYFLKATTENILDRLGITAISSLPLTDSDFSEGIVLKANKKELAVLGLVKKSILKKFDIKQDVFYTDFNWDNLLALVAKTEIVFKDIPKYPQVKRDFALLLDHNTTFKEVHDLAFQTERKFLKQVNLFDVYTGKKLPEGKKSYAVSFTLLDENSTLTDKQIDKIMGKLQKRYESELNAQLR